MKEGNHTEEDLHNTDQNNGDYFIRDEDHKSNESRAPVVHNMMKEVNSKKKNLINNFFRSSELLPIFSPSNAGTGSCLCSTLFEKMKESREGARSVKVFP